LENVDPIFDAGIRYNVQKLLASVDNQIGIP
jgi:hypothetical protein